MAVVTQYGRQTVSNESFDPNVNVTSRQSLAERPQVGVRCSTGALLHFSITIAYRFYCLEVVLYSVDKDHCNNIIPDTMVNGLSNSM